MSNQKDFPERIFSNNQKENEKNSTNDSFLKLLNIPAAPLNYRILPSMNKESCSIASQNNLALETSSASLIPQLWNPQNMVGYEQFQAHIDEPQVYSNNMDTDELDQLLDEFEDVFVKAGEDGSQLNMESMMDKMNGNNDKISDENGEEIDDPFTKVENGPPRQFSAEELAPQIIIRKAKKIFVPESAKDTKYWTRRVKNNAAARRSREARHKKENQIRVRAAWLEKENIRLRVELLEARQQIQDLNKERLLARTNQ